MGQKKEVHYLNKYSRNKIGVKLAKTKLKKKA